MIPAGKHSLIHSYTTDESGFQPVTSQHALAEVSFDSSETEPTVFPGDEFVDFFRCYEKNDKHVNRIVYAAAL